jgi:hypothetical protein
MCELPPARSFVHVKRKLLFGLLIVVLLVLALGDWTVQGLRGARRRLRAAAAPARIAHPSRYGATA